MGINRSGGDGGGSGDDGDNGGDSGSLFWPASHIKLGSMGKNETPGLHGGDRVYIELWDLIYESMKQWLWK